MVASMALYIVYKHRFIATHIWAFSHTVATLGIAYDCVLPHCKQKSTA